MCRLLCVCKRQSPCISVCYQVSVSVCVCVLFFSHPPISQGLQAGSRAVWVGKVSANLP